LVGDGCNLSSCARPVHPPRLERSATAVVWINASLHAGCSIYHGDQGVLDAIDKIRELAGEFNVREILFDPWRFSQGAQELEAEGIVVTAFPQSDARMMPASDRLYRAIVEQRLTLPDNPELRAHAHAAIARHSRRGWRIDKAQRSDNIDAVIAMCMALEAAENKPAEFELLGWL
jgi:phage terminase large subunit-like protein